MKTFIAGVFLGVCTYFSCQTLNQDKARDACLSYQREQPSLDARAALAYSGYQSRLSRELGQPSIETTESLYRADPCEYRNATQDQLNSLLGALMVFLAVWIGGGFIDRILPNRKRGH